VQHSLAVAITWCMLFAVLVAAVGLALSFLIRTNS